MRKSYGLIFTDNRLHIGMCKMHSKMHLRLNLTCRLIAGEDAM